MIRLGNEPDALAGRRADILRLVEQALAESAIAPLGFDFALSLYREGTDGLVRRLELAVSLATVMGRQGIVINTEYMHLSRSITAMLGSYMGIYRGVSRLAMAQDAARVMLRFPTVEGLRQANGYRRRLLQQVAADLPIGRRPRPANA